MPKWRVFLEIKFPLLFLLLCFYFPFSLVAEEGREEPEKWENTGVLTETAETAAYLGYSLEEAYREFGPPAEVFVHRGEEDWQDNVVFYYPGHLYLFWYENRVWQVRLDGRYENEFMGMRMGIGRNEVTGLLGEPFFSDGESFIYVLPDRGVPVRIRLFFDDNKLADMYVYRSDF